MVVFDGFGEVSSFVFACATSVSGVDVIWVDAEDSCEVLNTLINLPEFLEGATSDVVGASVHGVQFHELVAVLDGFSESPLLEERRRSDEQGFLVGGVFLQLFGTHCYQVVHVQCLPVH